MAVLTWGELKNRTFEAGVRKGVLYTSEQGHAWNGLISVNEKYSGGDPRAYYMDGIKYLNENSNSEFEATISAFTYPRQFEPYIGLVYDEYGIGYDQQEQSTFGLSYVTDVGNAVYGIGISYKIHLIYNALALPPSKTSSTLNNNPEVTDFSWDITTTPISVQGRKPMAHVVIDSSLVKSDSLRALENILYGTSSTTPRLPSISELVTLIKNWAGFRIAFNTDTGLSPIGSAGVDDILGNIDTGLFTIAPTSRLRDTDNDGLYTLE